MNVLLLVKGSEEALRTASIAVDFCKALNASIIALNVVMPEVIKVMVDVLGKSESEAYVDLSEDGWKYLYAVEELAKDKGVRIVLEQEEGRLEDTVIKFVRDFSIDLVVVGRETKKRSVLQPRHNLLHILLDYLSVPLMVV